MKQQPAAPAQRLVSDRQAAEYLGISRSQLRALVAAGQIPRVRVPSEDGGDLRRLLVDRGDLDKLIESWKVAR